MAHAPPSSSLGRRARHVAVRQDTRPFHGASSGHRPGADSNDTAADAACPAPLPPSGTPPNDAPNPSPGADAQLAAINPHASTVATPPALPRRRSLELSVVTRTSPYSWMRSSLGADADISPAAMTPSARRTSRSARRASA